MGAAHLDLDVKLRAFAPPWDGVSKPLTGLITNVSAARKATGLDWEPCTEPTFRRVHVAGEGDDSVYDYQEPTRPPKVEGANATPRFKFVTRGPAGEVLAATNQSYPIFTNYEMFAVAEAIGSAAVAMGQDVSFVAGGETHGGRRVFLMADLGYRELRGDPSPHARYLGMVSNHDGKAALKAMGCGMRWRCTNMIRPAELDAKAHNVAWTFRHTSNMKQRVADAQEAMTVALVQLDQIADRAQELLDTPITARQATRYFEEYAIRRIISKTDVRETEHHHRRNAVRDTTNALATIFASPTCEGITGTAYGPYAAAIEYLDHHRKSSGPDARFDRSILTIERGKVLALDVIRDLI